MITLGSLALKERMTTQVGMQNEAFLQRAWRGHLDAAGDDAAALAACRRGRHLQEHRRLAAALCGVVVQGGSRRSACAQEAPPMASAPAAPPATGRDVGSWPRQRPSCASGIAAVRIPDILQRCVLQEVSMVPRR